METPHAKELLKKMQKLEESQEHLKQEMSRLKVSTELKQRSPSVSARRNIGAPSWRESSATSFRHASPLHDAINLKVGVGGGAGPSALKFQRDVIMIVPGMQCRKSNLVTPLKIVGQDPINVMVEDRDAAFAMNVAQRCVRGESWTGEFPVKSKSGKIFSAVTTCSPFYDDDGSLVGIISITSDIAPYLHSRISLSKSKQGETISSPARNSFASKLGINSHQPIQAALASKISDLASKVSNKVRSKMRGGESSATLSEGGTWDSHHPDHNVFGVTLSDHRDDAAPSGASSPRGDFIQSPFGVFTCKDCTDGKTAIHKIRPSKSEECLVNKGFSWPWKGNEQEGSKGRPAHYVRSWVHNDQEKDKSHQTNPFSGATSKSNKPTIDESGSFWSSSMNAYSTSSDISCGSTSSSVRSKVNSDSDCLEYEILWDDLKIKEQIGKAVKMFSKQEYSEEVMQSFRQAVSLMKRLRHPNVLLFMGAVTSPQRLCIVSEFLPRFGLISLCYYSYFLFALGSSKPHSSYQFAVEVSFVYYRGAHPNWIGGGVFVWHWTL
ncbi:hypothetical protein YC2023_006442 [Brassica napus]